LDTFGPPNELAARPSAAGNQVFQAARGSKRRCLTSWHKKLNIGGTKLETGKKSKNTRQLLTTRHPS